MSQSTRLLFPFDNAFDLQRCKKYFNFAKKNMDIKEFHVADDKNHPWEYARSRVVNSIIKKYLNVDKQDKVAVDIGCGDVFFLSKFNDEFTEYKLIAVDTAFDNEIIAKLSKKYAPYNILFLKSIEDVDIPEASVIFLLDVIEHIENDVFFLEELAKKPFVNEKTLFVISVPAFNSLYCEHDKWLGHYRRYSQKTLMDHIKQAGLRKAEGGYFFTSFLVVRAVQKVFEKLFGTSKENGIGNWKGGKMVSWLYEKILWLDFKFGKLFKLSGLSTYVLAYPYKE